MGRGHYGCFRIVTDGTELTPPKRILSTSALTCVASGGASGRIRPQDTSRRATLGIDPPFFGRSRFDVHPRPLGLPRTRLVGDYSPGISPGLFYVVSETVRGRTGRSYRVIYKLVGHS